MNRRLLVNLSAAAIVVVMLVLFARTIEYHPARIPAPGGPPAPEAAAPEEDGAVDVTLPEVPAGALAEAAGLVRRAEVGFESPERLAEQFGRHGAEFGVVSADGYLLLAQALRDRPVGGDVLEKALDDGRIARFDRASGALVTFDAHGTIRTFFRPPEGEATFRREDPREPE